MIPVFPIYLFYYYFYISTKLLTDGGLVLGSSHSSLANTASVASEKQDSLQKWSYEA
jgi:hypothetical protein